MLGVTMAVTHLLVYSKGRRRGWDAAKADSLESLRPVLGARDIDDDWQPHGVDDFRYDHYICDDDDCR